MNMLLSSFCGDQSTIKKIRTRRRLLKFKRFQLLYELVRTKKYLP
jgi:hypothetical protein